MGRPSKLTPKQWAEVERRFLMGEKADDLGREFRISGSSIRERFSSLRGKVKTVADQLVSSEQALRSLPVSAQLSALQLADELRAISMHLASAARYSSATSHRLAGIAHAEVQKIDDAAPLEASMASLRNVSALTELANKSATIGLNLLAANKDVVKPATPDGSDKGELLKQLASGLPD